MKNTYFELTKPLVCMPLWSLDAQSFYSFVYFPHSTLYSAEEKIDSVAPIDLYGAPEDDAPLIGPQPAPANYGDAVEESAPVDLATYGEDNVAASSYATASVQVVPISSLYNAPGHTSRADSYGSAYAPAPSSYDAPAVPAGKFHADF